MCSLGVLALGIILFMIGWHLRIKEQLYVLILQGGAFGVLYIMVFAAFKLYSLVPLLLAFVCLAAICAVSVLFAVLQRGIEFSNYCLYWRTFSSYYAIDKPR